MKRNVMIVLGSLVLLAVFFVFALGTILEQTVIATEETSWIEANYVPAAKCGRPQTVAVVEPVALGIDQDRLALVPAASPAGAGFTAGQSLSVVATPNRAGGSVTASLLAAADASLKAQVVLQPSIIKSSPLSQAPSAPGLLADGPVSRPADSGSIYHLRVQVINTEAAGQELPYPGVVHNLMSLFFDLEPAQEPVQPVAPAV